MTNSIPSDGTNEQMHQKIIKQAIAIYIASATRPGPGDVIAHPDDPLAYQLDSIEGEVANCSSPRTASFPVNEIFDVNKVNSLAIELKHKMLANLN